MNGVNYNFVTLLNPAIGGGGGGRRGGGWRAFLFIFFFFFYIKNKKHQTPRARGVRGMTRIEYKKLLSGERPTKALTHGANSTGGRNAHWRTTVRFSGGGNN